MPILRQYADGHGFYLVGRVPDCGFGYCTWQIGPPGLAHLAGHRVGQGGDFVTVAQLKVMGGQNWVWTGGRGTTAPLQPPTPPPVGGLVARLERWAADGGVDALTRIACPSGTANPNLLTQCFPSAFLEWADTLDPAARLASLADISVSQFESLAANTPAVGTPLFAELAGRGATGVVWRLARVVGLVAAQLRGSRVCPADWGTEPLLSWLFRTLQLRDEAGPRPPVPRGFLDWFAPRIVWQVDLQQVVALLPAQRVPDGCVGVSWQVTGQAVTPRVVVGPRGRAIEESVSGPLRSASGYVIDLTPTGGVAGKSRWTFDTPPELPALLFHPDGRLADGEDGDPLPPGRYLCLVRPGHQAADGVTLVEPVDVGPVGWPGWSGWVAELTPGAAVPGYRVADKAPELTWHAEPPPDAGVQWLHAEPVYVGRLPRLVLSDPAAFRDAAVRVVVGDATAGEAEFSLPLAAAGSDGAIDLNAAPLLRGLYGRFRLRCQPPGRPDHPPLLMHFTRLPAMHFEYVPDPERPAAVSAVRVTLVTPLPGLTAGPDTELRADGASVVLRAITPESAPGVSARGPAGGFEFRVRVGVARGCVLTPHGLTAWQALPVGKLDLTTVGLDDRLRLEFPTPPFTHGGKIVFRLAGREDLHSGTPLDRLDPPRVYEVNLHRWRDGFGVAGMVQARLEAGWVDVAELTVAGPPSQPASPETWWRILADNVEAAVRAGDDPSPLIAECLARAAGPNVLPFAADLLPVVAARAALVTRPPAEWVPVQEALAPLALRLDLPEAKLLAVTFDMRRDVAWDYARLEAVRTSLPKTADAAVVVAECWYRQARSRNEFAPGCWDSCQKLCDRFLAATGATGGLAVSDAVLLRELAGLMLKQSPRQSVPDLLPGHRAWVEAVRAARRRLRWVGPTATRRRGAPSPPARRGSRAA